MKDAEVKTKADVYRELAFLYKWTFPEIAIMTPYQQAAAIGGILDDDGKGRNIKHFRDLDEALEFLGKMKCPTT